MKKLLFALLLMTTAIISKAQDPVPIGSPTRAVIQRGGEQFDSTLRIPLRVPYSWEYLQVNMGLIGMDPLTGIFYYNNGVKPIPVLDTSITNTIARNYTDTKIAGETLHAVTGRGATTTNNIELNGSIGFGTTPATGIRWHWKPSVSGGGKTRIDGDFIAPSGSHNPIWQMFVTQKASANNQLLPGIDIRMPYYPGIDSGFSGVERPAFVVQHSAGGRRNLVIYGSENGATYKNPFFYFGKGLVQASVTRGTSIVKFEGESEYPTRPILEVSAELSAYPSLRVYPNGTDLPNAPTTSSADTIIAFVNGVLVKTTASSFVQSKIAGIDTLFPTYTINVNKVGGLKGDYRDLSGLSMAAGNNLVTSASAIFAPTDTGKNMIVWGAGIGTDGALGDELVAKITTYVSATQVRVAINASVSVTDAKGGYGTDNKAKLEALAASNPKGVIYEFSNNGHYYSSGQITFLNDTNIVLKGNKCTFHYISSNPNSYISGSEPRRDLFNFDHCYSVDVNGIIGYNIGQTQARVTTSQEGNFWTMLNNTATTYNRRFNKHANTGRFIQNNSSINVDVYDCESYDIGTFYGSSGTANSFGYGKVYNNLIDGYALTASFPAPYQEITGNYIINTRAPIGNEDDFAANKLTSHAFYVTGGYTGTNIHSNWVIDCRGAAMQWNTTTGAYSDISQFTGNTLLRCMFAGYAGGGDTGKIIYYANNIHKNVGGFKLDNPQTTFNALGNVWDGNYYDSIGISAYSISRSKAVNIKGDIFYNKKNIIGISNEAQLGDIVLDGCIADKSNQIFYNGRLALPEWTGNLTVKNCILGTTSYVYRTTDSLPPNSARRMKWKDNIFDVWQSEGAIAGNGGVELEGNTFNLYSTYAWALNFGANSKADSLYAYDNIFINKGSTNVLHIAVSQRSKYSMVNNIFKGFSSSTPFANLDTNTYKAMGNYFSDDNTYDAIATKAMTINSIPEYADNAAAISAGFKAGDIYRTGDELKIVH